jgi:hypothetical protein
MLTEETRAEADRAREAFQKRLSAAESVRPAAGIEWDAFAKALPELDVAALRENFASAVGGIPDVKYEEAADKAAHEVKESAWSGFASYCASRVKELETLAAEQSKHKLHRWYRRRQLYSRCVGALRPCGASRWRVCSPLREREPPLNPPPPAHSPPAPCSFPGLYETLHHKVRGEWDVDTWATYLAYRAKATPLPWDSNHGEVNEEKKKELKVAIASKAGVSPEALGWK